MEITKHAFERGKERLGFNKKALERITNKAFQEGISHKDTKGKLHRYLTKLYFKDKFRAENIRIYGDAIFIIQKKRLITIYNLPKEFRNTIKRIKKKNEKNNQTMDNER